MPIPPPHPPWGWEAGLVESRKKFGGEFVMQIKELSRTFLEISRNWVRTTGQG